jgi:hypothetical protein
MAVDVGLQAQRSCMHESNHMQLLHQMPSTQRCAPGIAKPDATCVSGCSDHSMACRCCTATGSVKWHANPAQSCVWASQHGTAIGSPSASGNVLTYKDGDSGGGLQAIGILDGVGEVSCEAGSPACTSYGKSKPCAGNVMYVCKLLDP